MFKYPYKSLKKFSGKRTLSKLVGSYKSRSFYIINVTLVNYSERWHSPVNLRNRQRTMMRCNQSDALNLFMIYMDQCFQNSGDHVTLHEWDSGNLLHVSKIRRPHLQVKKKGYHVIRFVKFPS